MSGLLACKLCGKNVVDGSDYCIDHQPSESKREPLTVKLTKITHPRNDLMVSLWGIGEFGNEEILGTFYGFYAEHLANILLQSAQQADRIVKLEQALSLIHDYAGFSSHFTDDTVRRIRIQAVAKQALQHERGK